jgi:integrase
MTARVLAFARDDMTAQDALDGFLSSLDSDGTRRIYGGVLRRTFARAGGVDAPLHTFTTETLSTAFDELYGATAPATLNSRIAAVRSFIAYARRHGWPVGNLQLVADRKTVHRDGTRAIPRADLDRLWERDVPLREKTLWLMLYETAARAAEILGANIEDLDLENNRVRITRKRGRVAWAYYQTRTARLLPRLIRGRRRGPIFLASRKSGPARRAALADLCPVTGRPRLSYERAEVLFKERTGWTLHQLRHSALTHLGAQGVSGPLLMAKSGHLSLRNLQIYVQLGDEDVARLAAETDPVRRRK